MPGQSNHCDHKIKYLPPSKFEREKEHKMLGFNFSFYFVSPISDIGYHQQQSITSYQLQSTSGRRPLDDLHHAGLLSRYAVSNYIQTMHANNPKTPKWKHVSFLSTRHKREGATSRDKLCPRPHVYLKLPVRPYKPNNSPPKQRNTCLYFLFYFLKHPLICV